MTNNINATIKNSSILLLISNFNQYAFFLNIKKFKKKYPNEKKIRPKDIVNIKILISGYI